MKMLYLFVKRVRREGLLKKPFIHILLIIVVGIIVYFNTFNVPFHFDDTPNIVDNYKLRDLSNFWPPSGPRWFGFLTFAINYHLGGLNTTGYHIFNLAIHILNAILVYWLVMLTFKTPFLKAHNSELKTQSNTIQLIALFSGLIFAVHPVQTQAVTYIVQRVTSLATFFYFFSLVMYIKAKLRQTAEAETKVKFFSASTLIFYFLSLISAILAMKTKEIAFTLPIVVTLYEFMFFEGKVKKRILFLIPILFTMLIIPLSLMGVDKPIGDLISDVSETTRVQTTMPRWDYLFTEFRVIVTYIRLLFLPINQNLDYDYPIQNSFLELDVFLSFCFLLSIFGFAVYLLFRSRGIVHGSRSSDFRLQTRNFRLVSFGIFWFFITLSVESSIIPIADVINEHRIYLPSAGVFIAITTSIFIFVNKFRSRWQKIDRIVFSTISVLVILLIGATYARNTIWQDSVKLWVDVIKKSPGNARGYNELGITYGYKGITDKAAQAFQKAVELKPDFARAHYNLGIIYGQIGMFDEALSEFQITLRLHPHNADVFTSIGIIYGEEGLIDKAIKYFHCALILEQNNARAHFVLGMAYKYKGWDDKAIEHFNKAHTLNPDKY